MNKEINFTGIAKFNTSQFKRVLVMYPNSRKTFTNKEFISEFCDKDDKGNHDMDIVLWSYRGAFCVIHEVLLNEETSSLEIYLKNEK